jgi:hypothetical protein
MVAAIIRPFNIIRFTDKKEYDNISKLISKRR